MPQYPKYRLDDWLEQTLGLINNLANKYYQYYSETAPIVDDIVGHAHLIIAQWYNRFLEEGKDYADWTPGPSARFAMLHAERYVSKLLRGVARIPTKWEWQQKRSRVLLPQRRILPMQQPEEVELGISHAIHEELGLPAPEEVTEATYLAVNYPPELAMEQEDLLDLLQTALKSLPQREAEILRLRFFEELTYLEIGDLFGKTRQWAHLTIQKTLKSLERRWPQLADWVVPS